MRRALGVALGMALIIGGLLWGLRQNYCDTVYYSSVTIPVCR